MQSSGMCPCMVRSAAPSHFMSALAECPCCAPRINHQKCMARDAATAVKGHRKCVCLLSTRMCSLAVYVALSALSVLANQFDANRLLSAGAHGILANMAHLRP